MNDLFFVRYEPKRMLVDSMDMPADVELAHRRLCDFIWAMDKCPDDNTEVLQNITRVQSSSWIRVRGGLEAKGWHAESGQFVHNGALKTLGEAKAEYETQCSRARKAREAKQAKPVTSPVTDDVTSPVTGLQSQSQSQSQSQEQSSTHKETGFPSKEEVLAAAGMSGMLEADALEFWNHFESTGWVDRNGNQIVNWRAKMNTWKTVARAQPAESAHHSKPANGVARAILAQKELDRVENRIKTVRAGATITANGTTYTQKQADELKGLRERRGQLISELGFKA